MKKLLLILLCVPLIGLGQNNNGRKCGFAPSELTFKESFTSSISTVITIPVHVIVVHKDNESIGTGRNLSDAQILSQYYRSIMDIEKFSYSKLLNHKQNRRSIELQYAPDYNICLSPNYIFDQYHNNMNIDIKYYISIPNNEFDEYNYIKQEIDIINAKNIIPGYIVQHTYSQEQSSMIRYLFPDKVTTEGWKSYAAKMLIEEGFKDWDNIYHILNAYSFYYQYHNIII